MALSAAELQLLERFAAPPEAHRTIIELLLSSHGSRGLTDWLRDALGLIGGALAAPFVAVVYPRQGSWSTFVEYGVPQRLPDVLLRETLDADRALSSDDWVAAPLSPRDAAGELLVVRCNRSRIDRSAGADAGWFTTMVGALAASLKVGLDSLRRRSQHERRIDRLQTILSLANQWCEAQQMRPLLEQMAEAATRLLNAERASIFLWDRPNRVLVGRPAMGTPGGELRIDDNSGVVGQVVRTGRPRRVGGGEGEQEIDRKVDAQTGYQTHSVLCVPLRSSRGEIMGAFEALNKIDPSKSPNNASAGQNGSGFDEGDEQALTELASYAAAALSSTQQMEDLLIAHRQHVERVVEDSRLIGESPAIHALRGAVRRVAATDLAVLILGENGTGKEVASQSIHYLSARRDKPFIAVNCAALTETLLESELFGHEKGAFTDAHESRAGKFELANGGTLFLDEIGDLSRGGQAKLLRVLEEKLVVRVGGSKPIHTDARVIAATNQDLSEMVRTKRFREDLYFRLNVVTLELSPLRQRGDDVLLLAEHFLHEFCKRARRKAPKLTAGAKKRLVQHDWPGNVRELRNLMERIAFLSTEDKIEAEDLSFILSPLRDPHRTVPLEGPLADATAQFQTEHIQRAIDRARGNMTDAAAHLGLHRSNLYRKMRQLGMEVSE